jgi:hypothetical protein
MARSWLVSWCPSVPEQKAASESWSCAAHQVCMCVRARVFRGAHRRGGLQGPAAFTAAAGSSERRRCCISRQPRSTCHAIRLVQAERTLSLNPRKLSVGPSLRRTLSWQPLAPSRVQTSCAMSVGARRAERSRRRQQRQQQQQQQQQHVEASCGSNVCCRLIGIVRVFVCTAQRSPLCPAHPLS